LREISILESGGETSLQLTMIDGVRAPRTHCCGYGSEWGGAFKIELLPGRHMLTFEYYVETPSGWVTHSMFPANVVFTGEPGKRYWALPSFGPSGSTWGVHIVEALVREWTDSRNFRKWKIVSLPVLAEELSGKSIQVAVPAGTNCRVRFTRINSPSDASDSYEIVKESAIGSRLYELTDDALRALLDEAKRQSH
jgi:hypothetical protein